MLHGFFIVGSVMVTLFWYYRPEEATGIQSTDFQEVYIHSGASLLEHAP